MLFKCYFGFIYITGLFKLCNFQERIEQGVDSALGKKFVVYFVDSSTLKKEDDSWLCGGALVSPTQILTAAACLVQAEKIYAIAGYKKYIDARDIENDECTKARKQRVVRILIPTEYKLPHQHPLPQINVDVGVAIVEKPYNFSDLTYRVHCSYEPQPIFVNFEKKYELESTRAIAFGWSYPQSQGDTKFQLLQEAPTVIVDKKVCSSTVNTQEFVNTIEKYLLCASNNMYDGKKEIKFTQEMKDCKLRRFDLMKATDNDGCLEDDFGFRKNSDIKTNSTDLEKDISQKVQTNYTEIKNETNVESQLYTSVNSRRSSLILGPCQNGHGCPLIKWVGNKEIIIGVASNANENKDCNGPFLYVSTAATSKIIKCLLETNSITRKFCNEEISDKRYVVQEIEINWPGQLHKPPALPMPIINRATLDESPLVPRPTRDIYLISRTNEKRDFKSYKTETNEQAYKHYQAQTQSHNQNGEAPFNGILRQSYDQQPVIRNQQPLLDQKVEQRYSPPIGQAADPSINQQYTQLQPPQQYGPPIEQQFEIPQGQFDRPADQEYEQGLRPGQQYDPQQRQQYDTPQGQQFEQQPNQQYVSQLGQDYIPPREGQGYNNQQYDPQTGQPYQSPAGQPYQSPADQPYQSPGGQPYQSPPGQQYDSQTGQQYELPQGQQYELPPGQQYESPPGQQYEAPPGQEYGSPPEQQYRSPPGQIYIRELQNEPPPGQQFEPSPAQFGQQFVMQLQSTEPPIQQPFQQNQQGQARYDPNLARQYQQQEGQNIPAQSYQYQNNQQQEPQQQGQEYETPKEEQYNQGPTQPQPQLLKTTQMPPIQTKFIKQQLHLFEQVPQQQRFERTTALQKPLDTRNQKSASIDLIFSELHNLPNEVPPTQSPSGHEETFEQLYSHLHEPSFDLPHELTVPHYNGPPDDPYEENDRHEFDTSNTRQSEPYLESVGTPERSGDVRVRPQMPIDYQNDYFFYSYRKNGSN